MPMEVNTFPWGGDYRPFTLARMAWDDEGFAVLLQTDERPTDHTMIGLNQRVCSENCMELFLMPDPAHSDQYINWEFNPNGAIFLSKGTCREDRHDLLVEDYLTRFSVQPRMFAWGWEIAFRIPFAFLKSEFPDFVPARGSRMRANFYKIAELNRTPHFACWSDIEWPEPDFHRPEFFGDLILE